MIFPDETPPFAPDPHCPCCGTPWQNHPGLTKTCDQKRAAVLCLKATAVQLQSIQHTILKILAHIEEPETPTAADPQISDLLGDMEL